MRAVLLALACVLLLPGCSHPDERITKARITLPDNLPGGWQRVESESGEVAIGLPPAWEETDPTPEQFNNIIDQSETDNQPDKSSIRESYVKQLRLFFRHNLTPFTSYWLTGTVRVFPVQEKNLYVLAEGVKSDFEKSGYQNIRIAKESLKAGTAQVLTAEHDFNLPHGETEITSIWYLFLHSGKAYVLGFEIPPDLLSAEPQIDQMVKTFEIE